MHLRNGRNYVYPKGLYVWYLILRWDLCTSRAHFLILVSGKFEMDECKVYWVENQEEVQGHVVSRICSVSLMA